jgi:hypothetical protein
MANHYCGVMWYVNVGIVLVFVVGWCGQVQASGGISNEVVVSVNTSLGMVNGERYSTQDGFQLHRFLGIPFALPPVQENRFRPAQPPAPWGQLNATSYGAPCLQQDTWWVPYASNQTSEVTNQTVAVL